jgi:gliding motility-associated-like protein
MKYLFYLFVAFVYLNVGQSLAQTVKNNDCINVFLANRFICGNAAFTTDNVNGRGAINDFGPQYQNYPGCLLPQGGFIEVQSAWYAFKIQTTGKLTMDIEPLGAHDYDFAIFGPNKPCQNLGTPVRCSFAANPTTQYGYKTGMNLDVGDVSEPAGGDGYVKALDVIEGEIYYIMINNWSNQNTGFNINWGGVGKIANSIAQFSTSVNCNVASFNNTSSACDGVLAYEWDFGDGSPVTSENTKRNPVHYYQAVGNYQVKLKTTIISSSSDENIGIIATETKTVSITKVPPVITFGNLSDKYCIDSPNITLSATPTGGTFSILKNQTGTALTNQTTFSPTALGVGKHEVRYEYQDPTDLACKSVKVAVVTVNALPNPDLDAIQSSYCVDVPAFIMAGNPTGGTFKVNGTPTTTFNPAQLGAGNHTVTYDFTDAITTCSKSATKQVTVNAIPTVTFGNVRDAYCLAGSAFTMQGSPTGGTFKVNGITTTTFDIPALGIGTHNVEYSYTSPEGCSKTITKPVQIADKPIITFVGLDNQYCTDIAAFNLQATPSGGTFKVNGSPATQFNPSALSSGIYVIEYTYIDPADATCFNSATKSVEVKTAPVLVWQNVENKYCIDDNTTINPSVSIVYNSGATEVQTPATLSFNPSTKGVGNFTLSHTVTDASTGCVSTVTKEVAINALPTLAFVGLADDYCQQSFPVTLNATPTGGVFTVDGVPATQLNPRDFAVGDKPLVEYHYLDATTTCENSIEKEVEITPANAFTPIAEDLDICPQPQYTLEALTLAEETEYKALGINPVYYWKHTTESFRTVIIREQAQAGDYDVVVRDQAGCPIAQKSFKVKVDCEPKLFVPTAFTPNADGKNEFLQIFGEDFIKLDFKVFNRWGEVVFVARKKGENWDGKVNGKLAPAGVYAWTATFENTLKRGEVMRKQGQFVLIR